MAWVFNNSGYTIWIISAFICFNGLFFCQNHRAGLTLRWYQFWWGLLSSEYSMVTCDFASGLRYFINLPPFWWSTIPGGSCVTGRVPVAYSFLSRWWRNQTSCPDHQRPALLCFVAQPLIDIGRLLVNGWKYTAGIGLKHVFRFGISNFPDYFSGNFLNIKIGFDFTSPANTTCPVVTRVSHTTLEEGQRQESDPPMRQKSDLQSYPDVLQKRTQM